MQTALRWWSSVLWSTPVAASVAFTWALGTTRPEGSVTVPLMAPRNVCAPANPARNNTNVNPRTTRFMRYPFHGEKKRCVLCLTRPVFEGTKTTAALLSSQQLQPAHKCRETRIHACPPGWPDRLRLLLVLRPVSVKYKNPIRSISKSYCGERGCNRMGTIQGDGLGWFRQGRFLTSRLRSRSAKA